MTTPWSNDNNHCGGWPRFELSNTKVALALDAAGGKPVAMSGQEVDRMLGLA